MREERIEAVGIGDKLQPFRAVEAWCNETKDAATLTRLDGTHLHN